MGESGAGEQEFVSWEGCKRKADSLRDASEEAVRLQCGCLGEGGRCLATLPPCISSISSSLPVLNTVTRSVQVAKYFVCRNNDSAEREASTDARFP